MWLKKVISLVIFVACLSYVSADVSELKHDENPIPVSNVLSPPEVNDVVQSDGPVILTTIASITDDEITTTVPTEIQEDTVPKIVQQPRNLNFDKVDSGFRRPALFGNKLQTNAFFKVKDLGKDFFFEIYKVKCMHNLFLQHEI